MELGKVPDDFNTLSTPARKTSAAGFWGYLYIKTILVTMFQNLFAILLALCSTITGAQTDRLHQNNTSYLRTVLLQRSDLEMSMPIIRLAPATNWCFVLTT